MTTCLHCMAMEMHKPVLVIMLDIVCGTDVAVVSLKLQTTRMFTASSGINMEAGYSALSCVKYFNSLCYVDEVAC